MLTFALFFAFLFGPLLVMGITAFNTPTYPQVWPFEGFTLRWFEALLAEGDAAQALQLCDQALDLGTRTDSLDFQPETLRLRALATRALGDPDERVSAEFDVAQRLARTAGCVLLERRVDASRSALSGMA